MAKGKGAIFFLRSGASLFALLAVFCFAEDWPTYMHDKFRSGKTPEELRPPLQVKWIFRPNNPPQPAWPPPQPKPIEGVLEPHRLNFDYAYHVVSVGERLYFGSSANNKVYCLDARTGRIIWTFFADGPVRLAPTVWKGRLYFGSDDGCVYCLDAETGKLIWKFRAALNEAERVMGNGRLISLWPVRTGVLVDDGVAYFGAGVFPYEGVFLYAVRAEDGKVIWRNDSIGYFRGGWGSRSPQGYLLASRERLFVPMGRVLPACFDKSDGRLLYHHERSEIYAHPGRGRWPNVIGGAYALLDEEHFYSGAEAIGAFGQKRGDVFAWFPGRRLIVTAEVSYLLTGEELIALDRLTYPKLSRKRVNLRKRLGWIRLRRWEFERQKRSLEVRLDGLKRRLEQLEGKEREKVKEEVESLSKQLAAIEKQLKNMAEEEARLADELSKVEEEIRKTAIKWRLPLDCQDSLILSGGVLYAGGEGKVVAVDAKSGERLWAGEVEGRAMGLAVANGRLFVSTDKGLIYCFVEGSSSGAPKEVVEPTKPLPEDPLMAEVARRMLEESGVRRGICLVVGSGTGRLAYELARRGRLVVYGVEPDPERVERARRVIDSAGLYGVRVTIDSAPLDRPLPYPDYFADLIVSEALITSGELPLSPILAREICRVLKPCGGVALLGPFRTSVGEVERWLREGGVREVPGISSVEVREREEGVWVRLERGRLPGAGSWTHQYAGPGNTACSDDRIVKYPVGILWFGEPGPTRMPSRHAAIAAPLSAGGRFFVQGEDVVMAFDAYNGTKLWEREIKGAMCPQVHRRGSNIACNEDSLFVAVRDRCLRLDAETGKTVKVYSLPPHPEEKAVRMPFYAAPRLSPKVDGDLSDWAGVKPAIIPEPSKKPKAYPDWKGPEDLSGRIYLAWDEENLYFAAAVRDDVFHQPHASDRIWEADSIQIAFDIRMSMSYDREYGFCLSPQGPFVWCWFGPKETARLIKLAVRRKEDGLIYEAAIPWEALEEFKPSPGRAIGFSAVIMDSDGDGWEGGVEWASGIVHGKDPSLFGAVGLFRTQTEEGIEALRERLARERARRLRQWGYIAIVGDILLGSASYKSGWSDLLFALDAETGELLWTHRAGAVAHNAIAVGDGKVFLADAKVSEEERRKAINTGAGGKDIRKVVALDLRTGRVLWERVVDLTNCGPPLHAMYHKGLLIFCGAFQNGHFWREFFAGELAGRRITVLSAEDGSLIWSKPCNYFTRPLAVGDTIFADPWAYDLKTGRMFTLPHPVTGRPMPFSLGRGHHCGPLSASPNCLFMRSLTSAFYDLLRHSGVIHFGGHRTGCHINMIAANGLLIEPEASSGCVCAFSLYTTVVFKPRKIDRGWGMFTCPKDAPTTPVKHLAVNLGAPGDRRDKRGILWLSFPRPWIPLVLKLDLKAQILPGLGYFMLNPEFLDIKGTTEPWLFSFGCLGLTKLVVPVLGEGERSAKFTVRLGFCELVKDIRPGERVFDIKIQGRTVAEGFDIIKEAGGPMTAVVREFKGIEVKGGPLVVELVPATEGRALLPRGSSGWKWTVAYPDSEPPKDARGKAWFEPDYDDTGWKRGALPIGYGDENRAVYSTKPPRGSGFLFLRGKFTLDRLPSKGERLILKVASDDSAKVYINGRVADVDPAFGKYPGHEFTYWNREVEVDPKVLRVGENTVAVFVYNVPRSSDLYFDLELALVPEPKRSAPLLNTIEVIREG
ncbi:MAG TPA: methyltransferase domain-containing protein [Armatimonadetes bacterium]|nr:methyltransferase domain-containing protein [Armatimonadota bacterium]